MTTIAEVAIVLLSVIYAIGSSFTILIAWEIAALTYLIVGYILVRTRSRREPKQTRPGRVGTLDTLSWVLPVAASVTGINAAVTVIVTRWQSTIPDEQRFAFAIVGALGIIISWHLLHTGFAQMYESKQMQDPDSPGIAFPNTPSPIFADFLYFAFTVGTSFASSDSVVLTTRMRWLVLGHSVVSFFYNALVVAIAFQVLQQIGSG